jgi:hypothetical protein
MRSASAGAAVAIQWLQLVADGVEKETPNSRTIGAHNRRAPRTNAQDQRAGGSAQTRSPTLASLKAGSVTALSGVRLVFLP